MNILIRFLYKFKIVSIRKKNLDKWWDQKDVDMLILASEIGTNAVKLEAMDKLRTLPSYNSLIKQHLIKTLYSRNPVVSQRALEILKSNYMPRELIDDESYNKAVSYMEEQNRIQREIINYYQESGSSIFPLRKKKSDMKRLNQVKKALKKPIR